MHGIERGRFDAVTAKVQEVLAQAKSLYGVDLSPSISYNLRGKVAGWAGCKVCRMTLTRRYTLRFNRDLIAGDHFEDMRDETVPHEIAHLVCFAKPELGNNHNEGWKRVCLALGGNGKTRHSYDVSHAAGSIVYITDRGHEVKISKIRHAKVLAGMTYRFKAGKGSISRYCAWAPEGEEPKVRMQPPAGTPAAAPRLAPKAPPPNLGSGWGKGPPRAPMPRSIEPPEMPDWKELGIIEEELPPPAPTAVRQGASKASKANTVRAWIRQAKAEGRGEEWVIRMAQDQLGMARGLATKYVQGNWAKA